MRACVFFKQTTSNQLLHILKESTINHKAEIQKCNTWKDAHIYCLIHRLSSQQFGPLLERYISTKHKFTKIKAKECKGDVCTLQGKSMEIKVSIGGSNRNKFNYVQIRPFHTCDEYIMTAYHLTFENVMNNGDFYIFKIPKKDMNIIIVNHGGYAHGTVKKLGAITLSSLLNTNTQEYAIRPVIGDACWNTLLTYRIEEQELVGV